MLYYVDKVIGMHIARLQHGMAGHGKVAPEAITHWHFGAVGLNDAGTAPLQLARMAATDCLTDSVVAAVSHSSAPDRSDEPDN